MTRDRDAEDGRGGGGGKRRWRRKGITGGRDAEDGAVDKGRGREKGEKCS